MTKGEWCGLGIGCALLIFGQAGTFFTVPPLNHALDTGCYLLLTAGVAYWIYKNLAAHRQKLPPRSALCLAMALICWMITAKYMSAGIWYPAFMMVETFAHFLLYLSVRKVAAEA